MTEGELINYFGSIDGLGYCGSIATYFDDNLFLIEKFLVMARGKKHKIIVKMTAYDELSKYLFDNKGISTLEGNPLSYKQISRYISTARSKGKAKQLAKLVSKPIETVPSAVVEVKPSIITRNVEKPVVAVSVADKPIQTVSSNGSFSKIFIKPEPSWKQEEYTKAYELLKGSDGFDFKAMLNKCLSIYNLYKQAFNPDDIKWNDEVETIWVFMKGKNPRMEDKQYQVRTHQIGTSTIEYGKFWDLLKKIKPYSY